jgi:uncharacterized protein (DUF58 family)
MVPTRAAVVLLALGLVLWLAGLTISLLPADLVPAAVSRDALLATPWLVFGFDAGLLALVFLDGFLARRACGPDRLHFRRERPARLSLGIANEVHLVVDNHGDRALRLVVRDYPPAEFLVPGEQHLLSARVAGHSRARLSYSLRPTQRGNFAFGDLAVRCRGPLGLAWGQRLVPAAEPVQVYPNLLEVRRYESLVRSTLVRTGGYRVRRLPGAGREFSHYRDYTPDDDYRHVSWKATARRHRPVTTVFESEHSQDIIFCLDVGRMMAARVGALSKLDHAINAILMLTHVSQTFQDNLGLLVFSHEVHLYLPPGKGRAQHARFLQALYSVQPRLCYVNYREAFAHLIGRHPKRALTLVFTDLLDTVVSRDYLQAAALLKRFHLPLTLAVADVPLQDLAARPPTDVEEMYNVLVARDLLQSRAELLRNLERQGVLVLDTVPERLTVDAVNRYLSLKTGMKT